MHRLLVRFVLRIDHRQAGRVYRSGQRRFTAVLHHFSMVLLRFGRQLFGTVGHQFDRLDILPQDERSAAVRGTGVDTG